MGISFVDKSNTTNDNTLKTSPSKTPSLNTIHILAHYMLRIMQDLKQPVHLKEITMQRFATSALALLVTMMLHATAFAGVVPQWNYTVDGIFVEWTNSRNDTNVYQDPTNGITGSGIKTLTYDFAGGVPVTPAASVTGYSKLSWGDYYYTNRYRRDNGATKSSISIAATSGILNTGGAAAKGLVLTHDNRPIDGSNIDLTSGIVRAILKLTPAGGSALPIFSTALDFAFYETPNSSNTPNDVFVLLNPGVTQETFHFYGIDYVLDFTKSFSPIPAAYRASLNLPADAVGWVTKENFTTVHDTLVSIRALPTPEPTSILLMGAGLVCIALVKRNRRSA